jgi:hypothetical protein
MSYNPATDQQQSEAADKLMNFSKSQMDLMLQGVAAGYKIARGVHTQVAASDTVVTGLATVVAVIATHGSAPTVKQLFCAGLIGDQAGTPAAGSILINTYKPTAVNDVTPTAATDFTDNVKIAWIAIGT